MDNYMKIIIAFVLGIITGLGYGLLFFEVLIWEQ